MMLPPPPIPAPAPTPVRKTVGRIVKDARGRGVQDSMTPVLRTPVEPMPTRKPKEKR